MAFGGVDPSVTFNDLPPDIAQMVEQARQRQRLAQTLQQSFLQPHAPQQIGPVAARTNPLTPLLQALGSYVTGKTSATEGENATNALKGYETEVQGERAGVASLPPTEQIAKLMASRYAPNRQFAESLGKEETRKTMQAHTAHEDAVADAQLDISRGKLDVEREQMLTDKDYKAKYIAHLDTSLAEAMRHNKADEAAKIMEVRNHAAQVGIASQMLGVHRYSVGLDPNTGQEPAGFQDRVQRILDYEQPPPGGGMQPNTPRLQAQMDRIYEAAAAQGKSFDPKYFENRNKAELQFLPTAPGGIQLRSFANVDQHLGMLEDLSTAMQNGNVKLLNEAKVAWQKATGSPAPTNLEAVKNLVGGELQKSMQVHGGGEAERKQFLDPIMTANAPAVVAGAIRNYRGVLRVQKDNMVSQARAQGVRDRFLTIPETAHEPAGGAPDPAAIAEEMRRRGLLK